MENMLASAVPVTSLYVNSEISFWARQPLNIVNTNLAYFWKIYVHQSGTR